MKTICIYASELAIILGINRYQNLSDIIIKLWQKVNPEDYAYVTTQLEQQRKVKIVPKESANECLARITKSHLPQDISQEIDRCLQTETTGALITNRQEVLKKVANSNIDAATKKEFQESLTKVTNTNFGIKQEKSVLDEYSTISGKKISQYPHFIRKKLLDYNDISWFIGGKIDGITEDGIVIEVKNRIYRLFRTMRDYEKPQLQAYLYILGLENGHLVECLKSRTGNKMNIIEERYDPQYWTNVIIPKLIQFIKFFNLFLNNTDIKTVMLLGTEDDKNQILNLIT